MGLSNDSRRRFLWIANGAHTMMTQSRSSSHSRLVCTASASVRAHATIVDWDRATRRSVGIHRHRPPHTQNRPFCCCCASALGGKFSRMLDLGGVAPHTSTNNSILKSSKFNKNCHLQAVIFDFNLLLSTTNSSSSSSSTNSSNVEPTVAPSPSSGRMDPVMVPLSIQPDVAKIQDIAKLLNVPTGRDSLDRKLASVRCLEEDDLSLLLEGAVGGGDVGSSPGPHQQSVSPMEQTPNMSTPPPLPAPTTTTGGQQPHDIRSKYWDRIQKRTGSVPSSSMIESSSKDSDTKQPPRGDAELHWAARARVVSTEMANTNINHQWMVATGTGQLLGFLQMRSIQLGLAATPATREHQNGKQPNGETEATQEASRMDVFAKQLRDKVQFDAILKESGTAVQIIASMLQLLRGGVAVSSSSNGSVVNQQQQQQQRALTPDRCLWVSDRDDCLRAAKDAGLLTARIVRPNARRGNVSAHYTVQDVHDIQTVVNEINGISFNAVLQQ